MNEDELEVTIGDIYDVYNSDGKVYGYSIGFFVGDDPYNGIGNTYTFYADGGSGVSYISKKINWSDFASITIS